jgi:large subunit ribosomal protein L1
MTKLTKKKKQLLELLDPENTYSLEEAMNIFQSVKSNNFDESVDIALRLGIDSGKSDQNVRGAITLPHSLGKTVIVAVFADGDLADLANKAGAEFVGLDELAEKFQKNEINVDVVIASQSAMKVVGKLGQILGPRGLMPNPKTGTVTDNIEDAVKNAKSGQVRFRNDKNGIIHGCIGKVSFDEKQITDNLSSLLDELKKLKPASAKGIYFKDVSLNSTMGPGLKVYFGDLI